MLPLNRNALIAGGVVLLHVGVLWALQNGLLRRAVEVVVPVEILSEMIVPTVEPKPPQPVAEPQAIRPRAATPRPVRKAAPPPPKPAVPPRPAARPAARVDRPPSPMAPPAPAAPAVPAPAAESAIAAAPAAAPAAPAPAPAPPAPRVELPSSDADYLQNPKPVYPPMSKRMGEQGKVIVRVLIGADGTAQKAELRQSSGFERLDQAALETVMRWRYVPGKRAGVAETMWFNVPINFVLE